MGVCVYVYNIIIKHPYMQSFFEACSMVILLDINYIKHSLIKYSYVQNCNCTTYSIQEHAIYQTNSILTS